MIAVQADADEIRSRADEIVSRPAFLPEGESWVRRALGWVGDRIADLLGLFSGGDGAGAADLAVLALLVGLVALVWLLARSWPGRRPRPPAQADPAPVWQSDERHDADHWRAWAVELAGEGRYAEAVIARWRGIVARLGEARLLSGRDEAATSTEVLAAVAEQRRELSEPLTRIAPLVDEVAWAAQPAGPAELDQLGEVDRAVEREVGDR